MTYNLIIQRHNDVIIGKVCDLYLHNLLQVWQLKKGIEYTLKYLYACCVSHISPNSVTATFRMGYKYFPKTENPIYIWL